jgi:hypothetical protein
MTVIRGLVYGSFPGSLLLWISVGEKFLGVFPRPKKFFQIETWASYDLRQKTGLMMTAGREAALF